MGSYTLEIVIVFFVFAIVLHLLKFKEFAKKSFVIAVFAFASPIFPSIKNIVFGLFPTWFAIVLTTVMAIVILRYILRFFFGESTIHILANLVSVSAKGFIGLLMFIPKLVFHNQWVPTNVKKLGRYVTNHVKGVTLTTYAACKKLFRRFKAEQETSSEEPIVKFHKDDNI